MDKKHDEQNENMESISNDDLDAISGGWMQIRGRPRSNAAISAAKAALEAMPKGPVTTGGPSVKVIRSSSRLSRRPGGMGINMPKRPTPRIPGVPNPPEEE
jgi:phage tail tape-measure protein